MASTTEMDGPTPTGPVKRGAFILFEGVDRCGKTTQANLLVQSLKEAGHDACFMRFPGESSATLGHILVDIAGRRMIFQICVCVLTSCKKHGLKYKRHLHQNMHETPRNFGNFEFEFEKGWSVKRAFHVRCDVSPVSREKLLRATRG